jgi:hypothetical protein
MNVYECFEMHETNVSLSKEKAICISFIYSLVSSFVIYKIKRMLAVEGRRFLQDF